MTNEKTGNPWDDMGQADKLNLIRSGLPPSKSPKKIVIVGAGMAGLIAAYELVKAGHKVVILEAQHRIGGRVLTLREPFCRGLYAEAGAMRLPESHKLILEYVKKTGLGELPDENAPTEVRQAKLGKLKPFNMSDKNALYFFNGNRCRYEQYKDDPNCLGFKTQLRGEDKASGRLHHFGDEDPTKRRGYKIVEDRKYVSDDLKRTLDPDVWKYRTAEELWQNVIKIIKEMPHYYDSDKQKPRWKNLSNDFDHVSTRDFLEKGGETDFFVDPKSDKRGKGDLLFDPWSQEEINMLAMVENQQARLNNSVLALLREWIESPLGEEAKYYYLEGGMDQIPKWFLDELIRYSNFDIRFGAAVEAIVPVDGSDKYEVVYRNAAQTEGRENDADHVIFAVPFTALRHLRGVKLLSDEKRRAIQALNYSAAGKIFLQCRERFWEMNEYTNYFPIKGGRSQTDLAIRSVWYPQHGKETKRGVLLASYTWGSDAERWGHLNETDRIRIAIERINDLHFGNELFVMKEIVEVGKSVMWQNDPFAGGAFALFNPRQERLHREPIRQVEGLGEGKKRIHFAGEHTCPEYHRWIEGAVDSGLRTAWEVNQASNEY